MALFKSSSLSLAVLLSLVLERSQWSTAFTAAPSRPFTGFSLLSANDRIQRKNSSYLSVSIGIGPSEDNQQTEKDSDVIIPEVDHELFRKSRLTKFDEKCDDWFGSLLGPTDDKSTNEVSEFALNKLLTPVELKEDVRLPYDDPRFTAYVRSFRQPGKPILPAYGCENYGIPVPRRRAEAWRHWDVVGMVERDYSLSCDDNDSEMVLDEERTSEYRSILESKKVWVDDEACSARLIYINGRFCPSLSKSSDIANNLSMCNLDSVRPEIIDHLKRLPDGFTDQLEGNPEEIKKECGTNKLSQLSAPHHNTGDATSMFAVNNQQGMAAFAALNTVKTTSVALIDAPVGHEEELPVLVVNLITPDGGVTDSSEKGVTHHPRTLILADEKSDISVIQSCVDMIEDGGEVKPKLYNGYTQVFLNENATVAHSYVDEKGGKPIAKVELSGNEYDDARDAESKRLGLRDTHLECIDVHLTSDFAHYKGTMLGINGSGRSKIAMTTTLLKPNTNAEINGFSLSGGDQTVDMRTTIHHIGHETFSKQLQKNMVGGRATATFKGRIRVEQSAQQTDSDQLARTLMLSDKGKIWAIPSLEIIADDVKCTHGATIADLSEEELFYLRSRGLDRKDSRNILMYAFVDDVSLNVPDVFIKGKGMLKDRITAKLENLVPRGNRLVKGDFSSV